MTRGWGAVLPNDRGVGDEGDVYSGVGNQVGLELCEVHIQGPVKAQRGRDRGHNLTDQTVQVRVRRPLNVQVPAADRVAQCSGRAGLKRGSTQLKTPPLRKQNKTNSRLIST